MAFETIIWIFTIICLAPGGLYLLGRIKDPLHPTIYLGTLCFFVIGYHPLTEFGATEGFVSVASLNYFLLLATACVLGFYGGVYLKKRRHIAQLEVPRLEVPVEFDPMRLLLIGSAYTAVAIIAAIITYNDFTITGYLLGLSNLWVAAFILVAQAGMLSRQLWIPAGVIAAAALFHPVDRFLVYGQRGDTFRMALMAVPLLLYLRKRPPRAAFIPAALFLTVVMGTLDMTRGMVAQNEASNRIEALTKVIPEFFKPSTTPKYYGSEAHIYGAAMVQTVRDEGSYNWGRFVPDMVVLFTPKEWVVNKESLYSHWSVPNYIQNTTANAGYGVPLGAAPSGVASTFVEFWWFAPVLWGLLGYWVMGLYLGAMNSSRMHYHAYYTSVFIVLMYFVSQDLEAAFMNFVYMYAPLGLAYWMARIRGLPVQQTGTEFAGQPETA